MSNAEQVRDFTIAAGQYTEAVPTIMNKSEVTFLVKMILDEVMELYATVANPVEYKSSMIQMITDAKDCTFESENDTEIIAEQADAPVDIWYYCLNAFAKKGINLSSIFSLVHEANMNKRDPETGKFLKREDGKIIKPVGWVEPDITKEIQRQIIEKPWPKQYPIEPITVENPSRFTLFPINYPKIWEFYENQAACHWVASEIDYNADKQDWDRLTADERYYIEHILAFFAGADGIVIENLLKNFSTEVQIPEARAFYIIQAHMEQIHSETYSRLIETFIKDPTKKSKLFNAIQEIPCIAKKAKWAQKWMDPTKASLAERYVAFAVIEGVFFSGAFCAIFWLQSKQKMCKALGFSNELIARDESIHCRFAIAMYKLIKYKLSKDKLHEIFKEAVDIEMEFITVSLPCDLIGMSKTLMIQYIKYIANYWINNFGYESLYPGVTNPFDFMTLNDLDGKSNFFEKRVSEYQKSHSVTSAEDRNIEVLDKF